MRKRPEPRTFDVLSTERLTPHMHRVTLGGDAMIGYPEGQDGGYVKLMLPAVPPADKTSVRTYTIRHQRPDAIDIDFALHGAEGAGGPAVSWAVKAMPGDQIVVGGPGPAKPLPADAGAYLVLGDMTALPAMAVNLAALPRTATGHAVIEIQSDEDRQELGQPEGVEVHWHINPTPGHNADRFEAVVRELPWPDQDVYAWCASEFSVMQRMRTYLRDERGLSPQQLYISSYWKNGAVEDEHRDIKNADAQKQPLQRLDVKRPPRPLSPSS